MMRKRLTILKGGKREYNNLQEKVGNGERPFYRPSSFRKDERRKEKLDKKKTWYKSKDNKYTSVMFVDSTPNEEFIKFLKDIEKTHMVSNMDRIKFIQKSGRKVIDFLKKSDPF